MPPRMPSMLVPPVGILTPVGNAPLSAGSPGRLLTDTLPATVCVAGKLPTLTVPLTACVPGKLETLTAPATVAVPLIPTVPATVTLSVPDESARVLRTPFSALSTPPKTPSKFVPPAGILTPVGSAPFRAGSLGRLETLTAPATVCVAGKLPTETVPLTGCVAGKLEIETAPVTATVFVTVTLSAMPPPPPPPAVTRTLKPAPVVPLVFVASVSSWIRLPSAPSSPSPPVGCVTPVGSTPSSKNVPSCRSIRTCGNAAWSSGWPESLAVLVTCWPVNVAGVMAWPCVSVRAIEGSYRELGRTEETHDRRGVEGLARGQRRHQRQRVGEITLRAGEADRRQVAGERRGSVEHGRGDVRLAAADLARPGRDGDAGRALQRPRRRRDLAVVDEVERADILRADLGMRVLRRERIGRQ